MKRKKIIQCLILIAIVLIGINLLVRIPSPVNNQNNNINIVESVSAEDVKQEENQQILVEEEETIPTIEKEYYDEEKVLYSTTVVNIRVEPNTECEVYKTIDINTKVISIGKTEDWEIIKYDNQELFIFSKYLSNEKTIIKTSQKAEKKQATSRHQEQIIEEENKEGNLAGYFTLTYYCPCSQCSEGYGGNTAMGTKATAGRTIAADSRFPFGTKLVINGHTYTVEDRGRSYKR